MLVLTRKKNQEIVIGENITITIVEIRSDKVRIGIEAPKSLPVHRREVKEAIDRERKEQEIGEKMDQPNSAVSGPSAEQSTTSNSSD